MRAHLLVVNMLDETVVDEDVNDVRVDHAWVQWRKWAPGAKSQADEREFRLGDARRVELSPCRDRLARDPSPEMFT